MEQAEHQGSNLGVGLKPKPSLESADVVQSLVDDRQTDDRVDQIAVNADIEVHAQNHGGGVPQRKQTHIDADVLDPVKEKDDAEQKQKVVITRHHVFGTQVHKRQQIDA